jgi:hypothetical protein
MNQSLKTIDDADRVAQIRYLREHRVMNQGVSIVALKEGTPGANLESGIKNIYFFIYRWKTIFVILVSSENPPDIIGVNLLFVSSKNDPKMKRSDAIFEVLSKTDDLVDVYEKYVQKITYSIYLFHQHYL